MEELFSLACRAVVNITLRSLDSKKKRVRFVTIGRGMSNVEVTVMKNYTYPKISRFRGELYSLRVLSI